MFVFSTRSSIALCAHYSGGELGLYGIAAVLGVSGVGYYIFRGANNQKNRARSSLGSSGSRMIDSQYLTISSSDPHPTLANGSNHLPRLCVFMFRRWTLMGWFI